MARKFTPNKAHAVALETLNSDPVQRVVRDAAKAALRTFRAVASGHSQTGQFANSGRLVPVRGWDGRKGVRLEAVASPTNAPVPIETGTSDTPPIHALQAARLVAGRGGASRRNRVI